MSHEHKKVVSGLICEKDLEKVREAVCIQTEKVYDSCKEKDCIENARVMFSNLTPAEREIINNSFNVKIRKAIIKDVITDIEQVPFKRGFFTVDIKYIIRVTLDFFVRVNNTTEIHTIKKGEICFDKKVILFGSEGNIKIFKSHYEKNDTDKPMKSKIQQDNLPISKVEVAEPIPLNAKFRHTCERPEDEEIENDNIIDDERNLPVKRVYVTVGIFSIIKLVRIVQLLIPAFDFCIPAKECVASTEEDPCELFETIEFPFDEFFPPQKSDFPGALEQEQEMLEEEHEHHNHHNHCENHHCKCKDD